MSEIATELSHSVDTITTSEFLGLSFAERRDALMRVEAFRLEARKALADSLAVMVGRRVLMSFRPSMVTSRNSRYTFPVYSITDDEMKPLERLVTIEDVSADRFQATLGEGDYKDGEFDQTWRVNLSAILAIIKPELGSSDGRDSADIETINT